MLSCPQGHISHQNPAQLEGRLRRSTGPRGSEVLFDAGGNVVVAAEADDATLSALLRNGGQRLDRPGDLLLQDPARLDFRPRSDSPLVDAGRVIPGFDPAVDGRPDIGPFELGQPAALPWPRPRPTVFDANPPERISGQQQTPRLVEALD